MTKEQEQTIIEMYTKGATAVDISKVVGVHNATISKFVKKIGISRGRKSKKIIDLTSQVINDFIESKMYCCDIAKKYNIDEHTVYRILDEAHIKRQSGYHSNCIENYFQIIDTPHKAYLLGFITADGAIVNGILSIEIHKDDIELLEFAKSQINPKATITDCKNRNTVRITFGAKQIGIDLAQYGIVQNKSKTIKSVPKELIPHHLLPFYFRGLIDGDGCILKDGGVAIYSGSEDFIKDVQKILIQEIGLTSLKIYHGTTYFISWRSKTDKRKLFNYLYSNLENTFYYKRKYNRLLSFIKEDNANTEVT